jgi:hypothetical protein
MTYQHVLAAQLHVAGITIPAFPTFHTERMVNVEDKDMVPPQAMPTPVVATRECHLLTLLDARADREACLLLVEVGVDTHLSLTHLSQRADRLEDATQHLCIPT